jgi:hypothetical protein
MTVTVGSTAPAIALEAYVPGEPEPRSVSLADHLGSWVVLFFYPRDFTFVCPTELHAFAALEADFAAEDRISFKYLATIWSTLTETEEEIGPIAELQAMWRELAAPNGEQPDIARLGCERMSDFVVLVREKLKPEVKNLAIRGIAPGSQPFVLWKDRQYAANRLCYTGGTSQIQSGPMSPGDSSAEAMADRPDRDGTNLRSRLCTARHGPRLRRAMRDCWTPRASGNRPCPGSRHSQSSNRPRLQLASGFNVSLHAI